MQIRSRMSMSADGYVTTPSGWPALTADRAFVSAKSHGFPEFRQKLEAALTGRTTFEPALGNDFWPWPGPLGALDRLELVLLPMLFGAGMQLTR